MIIWRNIKYDQLNANSFLNIYDIEEPRTENFRSWFFYTLKSNMNRYLFSSHSLIRFSACFAFIKAVGAIFIILVAQKVTK